MPRETSSIPSKEIFIEYFSSRFFIQYSYLIKVLSLKDLEILVLLYILYSMLINYKDGSFLNNINFNIQPYLPA